MNLWIDFERNSLLEKLLFVIDVFLIMVYISIAVGCGYLLTTM